MKSKVIIGLLAVVAALLIVNISTTGSCPFKRMCSAPTESVSVNDVEPFKQTPFQAVTAKLQPGGDVYSYYKTDQIIATFSDFLKDFFVLGGEMKSDSKLGFQVLANVIENCGVKDIDAIGQSLVQVDESLFSLRQYVYTASEDPKGLVWNLCEKENSDFSDIVKMLPEHTVYANYNTLNLRAVFEWVKAQVKAVNDPQVQKKFDESLQMVEVMTGKKVEDILGTLQNKVIISVTMDPDETFEFSSRHSQMKINRINYSLTLKVKDSTIFDLFAKFIPRTEMALTKEGDTSYLEMTGEPLSGYMSTTLAQSGDLFIFATNKSLVDEVINGNGSGIRETELLNGLPTSGIGFEYLSPKVSKFFDKFMKDTMATLPNKEDGFNKFAKKFVNTIFQIPTVFAVSQVDENGYLVSANTSQDTTQSMATAVAVPAILAAIAVPSLSQNRERAKSMAKRANCKMVDSAVLCFLAENPEKVVEDVTWNDIKPFLGEEFQNLQSLTVVGNTPVFENGKLIYK